MTDISPVGKPLTITYLILRYIVVMLLTAAALAVIDVLLQYFLQYEASTGVGIVAVIVPAMDAGQTFARRKGRIAHRGEAWKLSAILFAVNIAVGVVVVTLFGVFSQTDANVRAILPELTNPWVLAFLTFMFVTAFLVTRWFFGSGAKTEMKRQARLAEKQQ